MNKLAFVLAAVVLLAACSPVSVYYQEDGSVSRMKSELLTCQVDALQKAPVANQVRQYPPSYVPSRRYCKSNGDCYRRGGFFVPGEIYSVDVNARLRKDIEAQCMGSKGYSPVSVPRCNNSVSPKTYSGLAGGTIRMPPLTESACVARNSSGDWQIIDPNG